MLYASQLMPARAGGGRLRQVRRAGPRLQRRPAAPCRSTFDRWIPAARPWWPTCCTGTRWLWWGASRRGTSSLPKSRRAARLIGPLLCCCSLGSGTAIRAAVVSYTENRVPKIHGVQRVLFVCMPSHRPAAGLEPPVRPLPHPSAPRIQCIDVVLGGLVGIMPDLVDVWNKKNDCWSLFLPVAPQVLARQLGGVFWDLPTKHCKYLIAVEPDSSGPFNYWCARPGITSSRHTRNTSNVA